MSRFRNIRVKMKGGKSRIQRAMVLASGKLRFVKNVHRARTSSVKVHKTKHRSYGGLRSTTRRGKGRHRKGMNIERTVIRIVKGGSLLAPAAAVAVGDGDGAWKLHRIIHQYTGFHTLTGKWEPHMLMQGWGPYVGVTLAEKGFRLIKRILSGF